MIVKKEDIITSHCVDDSGKSTGLFDVYAGDLQRTIDDIQDTITWVYGHLIYREKIIKCVRRGVTSLIGRCGPVDICKYSMFVETGRGCFW